MQSGGSQSELFLPPDEDNYEHHGIKNLVIKYDEFGTALELDDGLHKESAFYRKHMLDGLLEEFIKRLNEHLEPIKDECKNIDRFSMLLLVIGFFGTALFASVFGYLVGLYVAFILGSLFIIILALTFYRNNREL